MINFYSEEIQKSREWQDWRWQLQHRLTKREDFEPFLKLSEDEIEGFEHAANRFSIAVTPYVLSLMDRENSNCPIRKQFIPSGKEQYISPVEMEDPCGEDHNSPVPGLVHRYPDRVLLLASNVCSVYCRYCTRSRLVGHKSDMKYSDLFERQLDYIRRNTQVRDVLVSGGDPLLLSDEKLDYMLGKIREIPHVQLLRLGSRVPIVLPQRITDNLASILGKYHPFFMSLHVSHARELTPDVKNAVDKLCRAGIPLGSQTVLLKGINDSAEVMKEMLHKLLTFRIRPYYLYQCDPVQGTTHLRTSIAKGMQILRKLRGFTSGYAIPTYVVDAPGGGGKIPIEPANVVSQKDGCVRLRNWAGKVYEYKEESSKSVKVEKELVLSEKN